MSSLYSMDGKSRRCLCLCALADSLRPSRIVQYSTELEVKDYLRWRQVDSEPRAALQAIFLLTQSLRSAHQQHVQHLLLGSGRAGGDDGAGSEPGAERRSLLSPSRTLLIRLLHQNRAPSRVRSRSFCSPALASTTTACRRCFARARCSSGRMSRHRLRLRLKQSLQ